MRSVLCVAACAWFIVAALSLSTQTAGDVTQQLLMNVAQNLFVGLAILALAGIDWGEVGAWLADRMSVRPAR